MHTGEVCPVRALGLDIDRGFCDKPPALEVFVGVLRTQVKLGFQAHQQAFKLSMT